jgi:hypothetical protein
MKFKKNTFVNQLIKNCVISPFNQINLSLQSLSERERNHQAAVWELIQTEVTYIKCIRVIIDVFLCCMVNVQNDLLLNDVSLYSKNYWADREKVCFF